MDIVTRDQWGARPPTSVKQISIPTSELWLHHTADSNRGAQGVRNIQRFHMDTRGWSDIAYSFLVDVDGTVYEGRGPGRAGAHTKGHNSVSHAICAMGNYQDDMPPAALVQSIGALVRHGHDRGWWPARLTGGHRDVGSTSCPGRHLYAQIDDINRIATRQEETEEEPVNVPPLVKKAGDDRVWVGIGKHREHLADAVWKAMKPRDHTKIRTLPDDDPFWDLPIREDPDDSHSHAGKFAAAKHRHKGTVEVT